MEMKASSRKELAIRLKVERAKNGLSQDELAKASGVSACTIALIESGCKKKPRAYTLLKLAKVLNVEEQELLNYIM